MIYIEGGGESMIRVNGSIVETLLDTGDFSIRREFKHYVIRESDLIAIRKIARNEHLKTIGDRIFTDSDFAAAAIKGICMPADFEDRVEIISGCCGRCD